MAIIEELQPGSFRDIPFYFTEETKTGGQKTITHEYPFSSRRFTEQLGQSPPIFSLRIIIYGSVQNRIDFERALNTPGLGTLVHPIYGSLQVKATVYTVRSSQRRIGEFIFSVSFEASEPSVTASPIPLTKESVAQVADTTRIALKDRLEPRYAAPSNAFELSKIQNKISGAVQILDTTINSITQVIQPRKATFTRQTADVINNVATYAQIPTTITGKIFDCFQSALSVVRSPSQAIKAWVRMLGFGYIINPFDVVGDLGRDAGPNIGKLNTVHRQNAEKNRQLINEFWRLNALSNLYESAAYQEFKTDVELDEMMNMLETSYRLQLQDFYEADPSLDLLSKSSTVRADLARLRTQAKVVYDDKRQNVWRISDISPGKTSMALTTYRYYGNLDNVGLMAGLNKDRKVSFVNRDIKALTK